MVGQGSAHQHGYGHGHFIRVAYECWVLALRWLAGRFCKLVRTNGTEICLVTNNDFNKRVIFTAEWVSLDWMNRWKSMNSEPGKFQWASIQREIQRVYCSPWCVSANIWRIPNAEIKLAWTIHTNKKSGRPAFGFQKSECCFHGKICRDISCRDNSTKIDRTS
jgi:hypothetical protein